MHIRSVFLISIALGSAIGAFSALLYNIEQWSNLNTAKSVVHDTRLLTAVLHLPETLNIERAYINARLVAADRASTFQHDQVVQQLSLVDRTFQQAEHLSSDTIQKELEIIKTTLENTRDIVLHEIGEARDARTPEVGKQYLKTMFSLQEAAYTLATGIQQRIAGNSPAAGLSARLALRAWEFRDWSGRQTTTLISYVGRHLPMAGEQAESLAVYKGHLEQIWLTICVTAAEIDRPEIDAAIQDARHGFWEQGGEAFTKWVIPNRGTTPNFDIDQFVGWIKPILDTVLPVRDAALDEARRAGKAQVAAAQIHVRLSLLLAVLTIAAAGVAIWWFNRRVLRPAAEITATIRTLASGERAVIVPMQDRTDELGQMSRAIETLRCNAITADSEQRARTEEKARLFSELAARHSDLARLNGELEVMASTDSLTGLANRKIFQSHLEDRIIEASRGRSYALHCIDLDLFKHVNDSFGHPVGDALLQSVACRLRECVRETDVVARLGGDEFAILQFPADAAQANHLAHRVLEALSQPYSLGAYRAVIGASIGIMIDGEGLTAAQIILRNADLALYKSKTAGRGSSCLFEHTMELDERPRSPGNHDRREAIEHQELEIHH